MTQTNVNVQMQIRRDTAANWNSTNPVLLAGEWGYITDTGKFKIGNGSTSFTFLPDAVLSTFGGTLTDHLKISNQKELRLSDDTANTANEHYSSFKAGSQSANINYTLPTTAPTDNQYLKCSAAGVLSWDTFTGTDIADLVSNDANNRILTATGTTNSFNAEANLTYDGSKLQIATDAHTEGIRIVSTGDTYNDLVLGANRTSSSTHLGRIIGEWNGGQVASIAFNTGADASGKDDGFINFQTSNGGSSMTPKMTIQQDGKVGINDENPSYQLHVNGSGTNGLFASGTTSTAISLGYGASTSHILRCEGSELAIGLGNVSPHHLYIQGRISSGVARHIALNPLGGEIAIGSHTYENIPLHVQGISGQATILKLKSLETTSNQQWMTSGNALCLHQYDGLSFNTYTPSAAATPVLELQHQINHHGITLLPGKGINFYNYGQDTNTTSNKFDDYETGTFFPTINGSTTNPTQTLTDGSTAYAQQSGYYVKIGKFVFLSIDVGFKASGISGGTGSLTYLAGIPFRQDPSSSHYGATFSGGYIANFGSNNFPTAVYADPAQNHFNLMTNDRNIGTAYVSPVNITNNTRLICGITYKTDL